MYTPRIPAELCTRCKGHKMLCGLKTCPLLQRFYAQIETVKKFNGRVVEGSTPPTIVVGEKGYPKVPILISLPPDVYGDEAKHYDDPKSWWGRLSIDEILVLRSKMVTGIRRHHVEDVEALLKDETCFVGVALNPVDSELHLVKEPTPRITFSDRYEPLSLLAPAKKVLFSSNPRVPKEIEKIMYDDVNAVQAIIELYRKGLDVYTIQRALSLGLLGRKFRRRLVPTRWAITAVDRAISRYLLSHVKTFPEIGSTTVFYIEYLGNRFWIILKPGKYEINWVEIWHPSSFFVSEQRKVVVYNRERFSGTCDYLDGGFEAAKIAVLEALYRWQRQARVYIVREILPEYYAPVGNWHIRESVRNALSRAPIAKDIDMNEVLHIIRETSEDAAKALDDLIKRRSVLSLDLFLHRE